MLSYYLKKYLNIKSKRYFIVFYSANDIRGYLSGHIPFIITGINPFLNCIQVINYLEKDMPTSSNFVITNFIELNKFDYERYQKL